MHNFSHKSIWLLVLICAPPAKVFADEDLDTGGVLYFGFFFDKTTASSMKLITDKYFNASLSGIPEFSAFLQNVSSEANVTSIYDLYTKPLDPNSGDYDPLYHVTAKYCGRNQVACAEYEKNNSKFIDTKFEMHLVGYVLTPRTFGIRVDLTSEQKELFDSKNSKNSRISSGATVKSIDISLLQGSLPGEIRFERQQSFPPPLPAVMTKAHVTLGCAPGVSAVTTGPDALQAIEHERSTGGDWKANWDNVTDPIDPDGDTMRVTLFKPRASSPPSDYLLVIYPRVKLVANATLTRYMQKSSSSTSRITVFGVGKYVSNKSSVLLSISYVILFQLNALCVGKYLTGRS